MAEAAEPTASTSGTVRTVELPASAQELSTLRRIDYHDAFLVEHPSAHERTPLDWARIILEDAPLGFRKMAPRVWWSLGLRQADVGSSRSVLGWPIRRDTPEFALLGSASRTGMPAELLLKSEARGVVFATLVELRNPLMRPVWAAMTTLHQQTVRTLLERAVSR